MLKKLLLPLWMLLICTGCLTPEKYIFHREAEARKTLKLAVFAPLSGKDRATAEQAVEGITFAVEEVNAGRGIDGKRVELKLFDTAGSARQVSVAFRAARTWGADGALAVGSDGEIARAVKSAPAAKLPLMLPLNSEEKYLNANEFIYHANFSDQQQVDVLTGYLHYWRQAGTLGVFIVDGGQGFRFRTVAANASEALNRIGGRVVCNQVLPADGMPRESFLEMLKAGPRSILVLAEPAKSAAIIRQLREYGFNGIICGIDNWNTPEFFNGLQDCEPGEVVFCSSIHQDEKGDNEVISKFRAGFRKRFYHLPGSVEALAYDAAFFLMVGLSSADDLLDFDENWQTLRQHQGAAGVYVAGKNGTLDRTVYLNSIGVERIVVDPSASGAAGMKRRAFPRFSRKLQHSKLEEYSLKHYMPEEN